MAFVDKDEQVGLVDLINCDKFCDKLFKGLNFTGGQSSNFPIGMTSLL